ncbi:MAG: VOC family protein [Anaerolineae bacterium]|nr:VOC family protein [Anaerolineae bacterium]
MLRKIDCVMLKVTEIEKAAAYYETVFGLKRLWQDEHSVGMGMPETDAEMVLHNHADLPKDLNVHYLVDDVLKAVENLSTQGCVIRAQPFDIAIGKCAVIEDPFGNVLAILDMTKGART